MREFVLAESLHYLDSEGQDGVLDEHIVTHGECPFQPGKNQKTKYFVVMSVMTFSFSLKKWSGIFLPLDATMLRTMTCV